MIHKYNNVERKTNMSKTNQTQVIELLREAPSGVMSESSLRNHFRGKNFNKIINPMISRGEIFKNSLGEITLNVNYVAPQRARSSIGRNDRRVPFTSRLSLLELANYHGLTLYHSGLAELTKANSDLVEELIPIGLRQHGTGRILANPYPPLALAVFNAKKEANGGMFDFSSYDDVLAVIKQIDTDNSTGDFRFHHGVACEFITNYILDENNGFINKIAHNATIAEAVDLVDDIRNKMTNAGLYNARSLVSKVCKYFSEFNSSFEADLFYIDDKFVRESIPHYMKELFGVDISNQVVNSSSYAQLHNWLTRIHSRVSGGTISKSRLDHLLWYIYRK